MKSLNKFGMTSGVLLGAGNACASGKGWCFQSAQRPRGKSCKSKTLALSSFLSGFKS